MRILHEDAHVLAVDKPAGLPVIPGRDGGPSLIAALREARGEELLVVHRLDAGTSGVVLFARDPEAHRALSRAFEGREVEKRYLALVAGLPAWDATVVEVPLHEARRGKMRPAAPGEAGAKPSRTELRVVERFAAQALVEARPRTGRHHQIRVHLKAVGHPLAFDPQYGPKAPLAAGGARLARTPLHAASIEAPHPAGGTLRVEAPLPEDLAALLAALRGA